MQSKKILRTVIFSVIPILAVLIYVQFFRPDYLFQQGQEMDFTLSGLKTIELQALEEESSIQYLEVEISGDFKGIMDVELLDDQQAAQIIALKGPKIEHTLRLPWTKDRCILRFQSRDAASGKLHLNYRFKERE